MSKGKAKVIDYLFEDPEITNQKYALVSIVGPHMPQKCDVWGLKVRGAADSLENAKALCKRLLRIDNHYDIYTVDVGKFFPLAIDPLKVQNVEYQNTQLNELVKNYLENRENANVEYEKRKNDMIKKAIAEGKSKKDQENEEHPIAILNRIEEITEKMNQAKQHLEDLSSALSYNKGEYDKFTLDMRESAELEFSKLKISANEGSSSSSSAGASSSATGSSLPTISE